MIFGGDHLPVIGTIGGRRQCAARRPGPVAGASSGLIAASGAGATDVSLPTTCDDHGPRTPLIGADTSPCSRRSPIMMRPAFGGAARPKGSPLGLPMWCARRGRRGSRVKGRTGGW
jgi:hypothetical protein